MSMSRFGEIMAILEKNCDEFEAAVFFDSEGETIDYYSYLDPYTTRLIAAHHGILYESLQYRLRWLKMGEIKMVEICSDELESVTVHVGEEYYLTAIVRRGGNPLELYDQIDTLKSLLRNEIE